jgi:chromosome segregation ATPase
MVVRTAKDLEELQQDMNARFEKYLKAAEPGKAVRGDPEDLRVLVEHARASLDAAIRDKEEGLRIAELRIERRRNELASLESNLKRTEEQDQAPDAGGTPPKSRKGTRRDG